MVAKKKYPPKRHRGKYNSENALPYEISRGKIEDFVKCKACFWLDRKAGVKPPEIPSFTLNTTTDILLKRDADSVRGKKALPLWEAHGLGHLIPFAHPDLEKWTNSKQFGQDGFFNTDHKKTNLRVGGGLDDVFLNTRTGKIHIVDYKSTAQGTNSPETYQKKAVSLDDPWKIAYKRQMDFYVWVMRQKGFDVSPTGYFVYVDAQHKDIEGMLLDSNNSKRALMEFETSIIPYKTSTAWIEKTLLEIKDFLENQDECPEHTPAQKGVKYSGCDLGRYANQMMKALGR